MARYWVYDWLDDHGLRDAEEATKALRSKKGVGSLVAAAPADIDLTPLPPSNTSILAGRGLDLSGELDCYASSCRLRQVDDLFASVWHYFDEIVVADKVASEVRLHGEDFNALRQCLPREFEVLYYLRSLGSEDIVRFRDKMPACTVHWKKHAKEVSLSYLVENFENVARGLAEEGEIRLVERSESQVKFVYVHSDFEHDVWVSVEASQVEQRSEGRVKLLVAREVLTRYLSHLTADVVAGRTLETPLGSTISLHRSLLQSDRPTVGSVAFELQLPVLNNASIRDVLKIRQEEREVFDRFQAALRTAIRERISFGIDERASDVANEIREDVIDPALRSIGDRLRAAERLFARKSAVAMGVGVLTTVAGAIACSPESLTATASIGSMVTLGAVAMNKHLEERRDLELSDYYFLWRAAKHVA